MELNLFNIIILLVMCVALGGFLGWVVQAIWDSIKLKRIKKNIPKDEDGNLDKQSMQVAGKISKKDKMEVEENERERNDKFREFEKLRRRAKKERSSNTNSKLPKRDLLQSEPGVQHTGDREHNEGDESSIELHKPKSLRSE